MPINFGKSGASAMSTRLQQLKSQLGANVATNSSGTVGVAPKGISKIGNIIGKAANVAGKLLPGVGGAIGRGLASLFNDPEWWSHIEGDDVTLNNPLTLIPVDDATAGKKFLKVAIGEIVTADSTNDVSVIRPTDNMITQYLLPEIRQVVNAIPLQSAAVYSAVLQSHATIYALWQCFKKYDYMLKHGTTYVPNLNATAFPILQVDNAAWLQSTIARLEEYLRANVRLPHTLCCYLAWRFGRVYKSADSAKAGLILYNVVPMMTTIANYNTFIAGLMSVISSSVANQQANADLFNVYKDHDQAVQIKDDTQFRYDRKEFMLRTNTDVYQSSDVEKYNPVFIDSGLDNRTVFMASTVSSLCYDDTSASAVQLFRVRAIYFYAFFPGVTAKYIVNQLGTATEATSWTFRGGNWYSLKYSGTGSYSSTNFAWVANHIMAMKALDVYNKGIYVTLANGASMGSLTPIADVDITSLSYDSGTVPNNILGNEQVYAFANLMYVDYKRSPSIAEQEKELATEVANVVEKLDVAVVPAKQ